MKLLFLITFLFSNLVFAKYDSKIIEIKRALSLSDTQSHHKEFYINAGSKKGVKENQIIPVLRKKTFIDPLENKTVGDLWLPVGEVKILFTGPSVSIGRIHKVPERDRLPELDYPTFMIGDRLDLKAAQLMRSKTKNKKSPKYSKKKKRMNRKVASKVSSQKKSKKGQYSFPDPVREQLNKKITTDGTPLTGSSATGINSQYLIKPQ